MWMQLLLGFALVQKVTCACVSADNDTTSVHNMRVHRGREVLYSDMGRWKHTGQTKLRRMLTVFQNNKKNKWNKKPLVFSMHFSWWCKMDKCTRVFRESMNLNPDKYRAGARSHSDSDHSLKPTKWLGVRSTLTAGGVRVCAGKTVLQLASFPKPLTKSVKTGSMASVLL